MKNNAIGQSNLIGITLIAFAIILAASQMLNIVSLFAIISLIKAILLVVVFILYGVFVLNIFGIFNQELAESLAVGIIFGTFYFMIFGFLKLINHWSIISFFILPLIVLGIYHNKNRFRIRSLGTFFYGLDKWVYFLFIIPLLYCFLPSSFYDTLVYHLGIPNFYIQHGGFFSNPHFVYFNTSIYYEISLIPAVFLGELVPRLFHFLISFIFIIAIHNFAGNYFNITRKWLIVLMIFTMPVTIFLMTTVKNDLISAFFIFLGIKSFFDKKIYFSAILWGFSLGVKYFNIIPLFFFMAIFIFKTKSSFMKTILIFFSGIFIINIPLFLKNIIYIGDPLYPFLYNYFPTLAWDNSRAILMSSDVGAMIKSISDFFLFPYTISFKLFGYIGYIGPQFLAFLPFLLICQKKHTKLLLFSLSTLIAGAFFTNSLRFLYIVFILMSLISISIIDQINKKSLLVLAITFILFNFVISITMQESLYKGHQYYADKLNYEEYKATMFPAYQAYDYINKHADKNTKILIIGEARNYYLKTPYLVSSALDYCILRKYLNTSNNINEFINHIQSDGFNYLVFSKSEWIRLQQSYHRLTEDEIAKAIRFLNKLKVIFEKNNVYVYELALKTY